MDQGRQYRLILRPLVFAACAAPAVLMTLATFGIGPMELGADPLRRLIHACGTTALNLLLITLAVTPLRMLTHWNDLIRLRRMLGLFAFFYVLLHFTAYGWFSQQWDFAAIGADIIRQQRFR